jgi:cell division septum initiation protein DivIVA
MGSKDSGLTGEFGALPQLDRPPVGIDGYDRAGLAAGGAESLDGPAARQKSLELVRAAVELADRVESQARDAAAEQLRRADDESSRRRGEIEARELEFERVRQDLERQHQQAAEATHAAQVFLESAQQEAAQTLEQARAEAASVLEPARAEAASVLEQARAEAANVLEEARAQANHHQQAAEATHAAQALLERAQHEAAQTLEQARAEAARVLEEARAEANGFREQASAEAEALRQSEHEKVEQAVKQAVQQAKDVQLAQVQSPQPTNGAVKDDPEPRFAPPPLSPEDLASGTLPRFVQRPGAQR